jgi:hypothetical protein
MKLKGHDFSRPSVEMAVIPRGYDQETGDKIPDVVFVCQPVMNYDEFNALVKQPEPPEVMKAGGVKEYDFEDPTYVKALEKFGRSRYDYMFLKSISATPDLEWDTVKMGDPKTWSNWEEELKKAGFSVIEIGIIQNKIMAANSLDQRRVNEALANFQRGRAGS